MTKVTRYNCDFCKKDYRTPNRHDCKFDPEKRNCFTCKHSGGFEKDDSENEYGNWCGELYIVCDAGHDRSMFDVKHNGYRLMCDEWEPKEKGEKSRGHVPKIFELTL